jgi:hypothetical protein
MSFIRIEARMNNLDEIMQEYEDGYDKVYKHIPDLVAEIELLREVAEASSNMVGDKSIQLKLALKKLDEARR